MIADIKWIARGEDGRLFTYTDYPDKRDDHYYTRLGAYEEIKNDHHPMVTWEGGPVRMTITLELEEK